MEKMYFQVLHMFLIRLTCFLCLCVCNTMCAHVQIHMCVHTYGDQRPVSGVFSTCSLSYLSRPSASLTASALIEPRLQSAQRSSGLSSTSVDMARIPASRRHETFPQVSPYILCAPVVTGGELTLAHPLYAFIVQSMEGCRMLSLSGSTTHCD